VIGDDAVWVGFDLGTQSARALAVSGSGEVVGRGSEPLTGTRRGPCHEQDPELWWQALAAASRCALDGVAPARVRGVATDATSGTILLVDRSGDALTPGLMYDDARAVHQARLVNEAGKGTWDYRMQPGWALPKLLWLLDERSEIIPGARLSHQADYITRRLVGHEVPADSSHALKTGYDLARDSWPREVLDELRVPGHLLPDVVRSGSRLGQICEAADRQTGIPAGTPVIAGMTDGCGAQLAAGALSEGSSNSVLGTTLALKGASSERVRDPAGLLYSHRSPDGGWLPGAASSSGAGVLSTAFPERDLDELGRRAAEHEQTDVLAYPLASRGERFPFEAPGARGFLIGEPADEGERFAALLQGLAFLERLCFDYLDLLGASTGGDLILTGGATRGHYLTQLRADVLGRPVRVPLSAESAFGMAVLAASDGGRVADAAAGMVQLREVIEPREGRRERFNDGYVRLVGELEHRGWLGSALAEHARARMSA